MAGEHKYFCEDEVFKLNNKGNVNLGTVLENSELLDSDDSFDLDNSYKMKSGHVRVAWHPTGEKELIKDKKVSLSNRPLMPGDVVRRMIKGKDTQRGYCRDVKVSACVQIIGTKNVINGVKSEKMNPLREFATGVAVCIDSWVGHIKKVNSRLILRTSDGSRFFTKDFYCTCGHDFFREKKRGVYSHRGEYYPGQKLWGPLHGLDQSSWLTRTKNLKFILGSTVKSRKPVEVTVESIEVESVHVNWRCQAFSKGDLGDKGQPDSVVSGENLKRLKMLTAFEPCAIRVGDRSYYTLTKDDTVISKRRWKRELKEVALGLQSKSARRDVDISSFQTTDSDETQSGDLVVGVGDREELKKSEGALIYESSTQPAEARRAIKGPRVMTRLLKKKKLRRARIRPLTQAIEPNMRFVVETISTASRATVVWQDGTVEPDVRSTELYPMQQYHRELFPGDFVWEAKEESSSNVYGVVQSVDRPGRTAKVQWFRSYTSPGETRPTPLDCVEVSVYDLKIHRELQLRQGAKVIKVANFESEETECFVGEILDDYPEGKVMVQWVDGNTSMCWPQDLCKVQMWKCDYSDDEELWVNVSAETSWETENINLGPEADKTPALRDSRDQEAELHPDADIDGHPTSPSHVSVVSTDVISGNSPSVIVSPEPAKEERGCFSVLDTAPDSHKYKLTKFQPTAATIFCKTVRREINILRTSLPSGIWVKSFEDRMDLFSVMIRGPEKTPYEDGLFLFDVQLPADYPHVPPLCHYISYCSGRLNPNLYEEGKVCVSLLGTWTGKGTEVWTADSNVLQVLVSIQGLILVSEPYFNEPGCEKQKGTQQGWENSRTYNETVLLKMVQNVSEMIQRPPPVFREEVMRHFAENARKLCDRMEGWLELSERFEQSQARSPASPSSLRAFHHRESGSQSGVQLPEYPLLPASKGFRLSLRKRLMSFRDVLLSLGITPSSYS